MPEHNERTRERAYFLWLEEGCPEGQAERHWLTALTLIEGEPLEPAPVEDEPAGEPAREPPAGRRVRGAGVAPAAP
ncbi:MAG TPA: DUF2934 domain-containing protein [Roseiarcus sp.]